MKKLNLRNFDVSKLLTESDYQVLLSAGRLFVTKASFTEKEAIEAGVNDCRDGVSNGVLIADDPEDALRQAEIRGFGEEVMGVLFAKIPRGKTEIPISAN